MSVDRTLLRRESLQGIGSSPVLFLEVFFRLSFLFLAMRFSSLKNLTDRFKKSSRRVSQCQLSLIQRFSGIWERHFFRKQSCLTRSLLLFWMAPQGSRIYIGVLEQKPDLEAHAWIESDGHIFSGTEDYQKY